MADYPSDDSAISLESALEKIEQLENGNIQLSHDLDECRDLLFDILQKENEVPEQRVKDEFIRIFVAIDSWIDEVSVDDEFDFKNRYASNIHGASLKNSFRGLGLKGGCLDISWAKKLGELEACRYVVLSLAVTRHVVEEIFGVGQEPEGDLFPPGIIQKQIDVIEQVKNAMGSDSDTPKGGQPLLKSKPQTMMSFVLIIPELDTSQYSKWRGQTLSALMSTDRYKEICDKEITYINESLRTDLAKWIDGKRLDEHFGSLRSKVLDPAYKLLHIIGLSKKTYQLRLEEITPSFIPPSDSSWGFKEMTRWMMVHSSEVIGSIRYLYPGLIRKGYGNQEDLILVRPVALGYRNPDLQPRSSTSRSSSTSTSPRRPNIKSVERIPTDLAGREQRRSKRDAHEGSRSSNKSSRADNAQKKKYKQGLYDQPQTEHKSRGLDGTMLNRAGEFLLGRPFLSSGSRASHPALPKNEGKRSIGPGAPRSETWPPESRAYDADIRGSRYGPGGQNDSDLYLSRETGRHALFRPPDRDVSRSPSCSRVSEFFTENRHAELSHQDALAAAQVEHERVRHAATRVFENYEVKEGSWRLQERAEERLWALKLKIVPKLPLEALSVFPPGSRLCLRVLVGRLWTPECDSRF
ncbi:hypothetical protein F5X98DRAFT_382693 [Xylaria grammica]|nr:hypothetical protein F5X98DRAFT_382693 [Xylaria grammica]